MASTATAAAVFPTTPNPLDRNYVEKRSRNGAVFLNKATIISAGYRESSLSSSSAIFIKCPFRRRPAKRNSSYVKPFTPVMEWQDYKVKIEIDVPVSVAYNCYSDREAIPQWMPIISSVTVQLLQVQFLQVQVDRLGNISAKRGSFLMASSASKSTYVYVTVLNINILSYYGCYEVHQGKDLGYPKILVESDGLQILEDKPDLSQWSMKYNAFGHDIEFSWLARNMQPIQNQKIHWRSVEGLPNRGAVRFFPKGDSSCVVELTVSCEVPQILLPVASALQPFSEGILVRGLERFAEFVKTYPVESTS